jgi:hypothetical protein
MQSKFCLSSKRRMSPYNSNSSSSLVDEMVNWSDPSEIAKDSGELSGFKPRHLVGFRLTFGADVIPKVVFSLFGVYAWELLVTWDFEWSLIARRRSFRWPLVKSNS